jgi:hypothetical protein
MVFRDLALCSKSNCGGLHIDIQPIVRETWDLHYACRSKLRPKTIQNVKTKSYADFRFLIVRVDPPSRSPDSEKWYVGQPYAQQSPCVITTESQRSLTTAGRDERDLEAYDLTPPPSYTSHAPLTPYRRPRLPSIRSSIAVAGMILPRLRNRSAVSSASHHLSRIASRSRPHYLSTTTTRWLPRPAQEPRVGTTTPVPDDHAPSPAKSPFYFEAGYALYAKRPSRPFPPPFLTMPSSSFSEPLSTHDRSKHRRPNVNGEMIRGITNGDDAVLVQENFVAANDGVGAWATKERGHAAYVNSLLPSSQRYTGAYKSQH